MSCTPFILPQPKDHIIRLSDGERLAVSETHSRGVTAVKGYSELVYVPASDLEFADPAVYAKRLMEAAYRADTSPLPEWLANTIADIEQSKHGAAATVAEIADYQMWMLGAGSSNPDKALEALSRFTTILRWQAQQEGGAQ